MKSPARPGPFFCGRISGRERPPLLPSYGREEIVESMLVSLDGVIGDPQVWAQPYFDQQAGERALKQLLASDAMLMGRRTYELFAAMWPASTGAEGVGMTGVRRPSTS
jgi:hypothetical protein